MSRWIIGLMVPLLMASDAAAVVADAALPNDAGKPLASRSPSMESPRAVRALTATLGFDYDEARDALASGDPDDPDLLLERGRLALYEAEWDSAVRILSRPEVRRSEQGAYLLDVARGCARAFSSTVVERGDGIEVRFQDEHDRALAPLLFDSIARAKASLSQDLGVTFPTPLRVTLVRDQLSLSAVTGLPLKSAQTTGTVAVAKWGRVTLLSPRASLHGFSWRDTMAHELTHLAVTRLSQDNAPLWLQEGLAKRGETLWRERGPYDDRPSPEAIVLHGMERKLTLPLDKLGPSIAMLPSAEAALVAYAEVSSFVRYLVEVAGKEALSAFLFRLRTERDESRALKDASGATLAQWDVRWRAHLAGLPKGTHRFSSTRTEAEKKEQILLRDGTRLAELLLSLGHGEAARKILEPLATKDAMRSAGFRTLDAYAWERAERPEEARKLLHDPADVESSFGPYWALRGRLLRLASDEEGARRSFDAARGEDPFGIWTACEGGSPADPGGIPLCEVARSWSAPTFGRE